MRGVRPWHTAWCPNATAADWPVPVLKQVKTLSEQTNKEQSPKGLSQHA